jgi:SAM-dependent methyltransferase
LVLFFRQRPDLFRGPVKLLHVAPEAAIRNWIKSQPSVDYLSGDIADPTAMVKLDLMNVHYDANAFDAVICNHVLEHVPDDRKAMAEIWRILRPGGWSILLSPIHPALNRTREDPTITDPAERQRLFGQHDHLRWYGQDYGDRLKAAAFEVHVVPFARQMPASQVRQFGLQLSEDIFLCIKPAV